MRAGEQEKNNICNRTEPNEEPLLHLVQRCIAEAGTVAELGRQIKIDPSAIHSWLNGSNAPRRSSVCRLICFLRKITQIKE